MSRKTRFAVGFVLFALLFSVCAVLFLPRLFPFETFQVEGFSMEPTLAEYDNLIVNRIASINRGDIVTFDYPNAPIGGFANIFVKRIIGLPSETIRQERGVVYINDEPLGEPYLLPENAGSYTVSEITLGPDEYWILGDNRDQSSDSHAWGPLPAEYIRGEVIYRYWPPTTRGAVR